MGIDLRETDRTFEDFRVLCDFAIIHDFLRFRQMYWTTGGWDRTAGALALTLDDFGVFYDFAIFHNFEMNE